MQTVKIPFDIIVEQVENASRGKKDYYTTTKNLHMWGDGTICFKKPEKVRSDTDIRDVDFKFTEWAGNQIFNRMSMPAYYFSKLIEQCPDMVADHFNFWAEKEDRDIMIRARELEGNNYIRGFVSGRYSVLDNDFVIDRLAETVKRNPEEYSVERFHIDEKRMHIRFAIESTKNKAFGTALQKGDVLMNGVDLINSEVGASSLSLSEMVYRLVCLNGLKRWKQAGETLKQRHIYISESDFQDRISAGLITGLESGAKFMQDYIQTKGISIFYPAEIIVKLARAEGLGAGFVEKVLEAFQIEDDYTAYGLVNAITRAAKNYENERMLELEKLAGKVVYLKPSEWESMDVQETE